MNKKKILFAAFFLIPLLLWTGDTAVFVDLGFSADGRTYMFGQYGVQPETLKPWADVYVVDVASNNFVTGGKVSYVHDSPVTAGHDGAGALYRIIARNSALADRHHIGYLLQGQLLYLAIEGGGSGSGETIEFRNFEKNVNYTAALYSNVYDVGGASFYIRLNRRSSDGSMRSYSIGNSGTRRVGVMAYRIHRVLASPNNDSLIFVIEMRIQGAGNVDIRYMVETVKL
jgi:predicted secreted protein